MPLFKQAGADIYYDPSKAKVIKFDRQLPDSPSGPPPPGTIRIEMTAWPNLPGGTEYVALHFDDQIDIVLTDALDIARIRAWCNWQIEGPYRMEGPY